LNPESGADVLTVLSEVLWKQACENGVTPKEGAASNFDEGLANEAICFLKKAIEMDPNYIDALVLLGRIHEKKGLIEDAIKYTEKAVM
jgi:tetratricopeptide (TPR) repeat protein